MSAKVCGGKNDRIKGEIDISILYLDFNLPLSKVDIKMRQDLEELNSVIKQ